jgi:hypothetical protein
MKYPYLDVEAPLPSVDFDQLQPSARQLELHVEDAVVQLQPVAALGSSNDDPLLDVAAQNIGWRDRHARDGIACVYDSLEDGKSI